MNLVLYTLWLVFLAIAMFQGAAPGKIGKRVPKNIEPSLHGAEGRIINGQSGRSEVCMRRPLCTILASLVLVTNLLAAQESKSQSSESGVVSTAPPCQHL
jgi:hypothetical protein